MTSFGCGPVPDVSPSTQTSSTGGRSAATASRAGDWRGCPRGRRCACERRVYRWPPIGPRGPGSAERPSRRHAGPSRIAMRASAATLAMTTNRWSPELPRSRSRGPRAPRRRGAAAAPAPARELVVGDRAPSRRRGCPRRGAAAARTRRAPAGRRRRAPRRGRRPRDEPDRGPRTSARSATTSTSSRPRASTKLAQRVGLAADRVDERPPHLGASQREHDARDAAARPEIDGANRRRARRAGGAPRARRGGGGAPPSAGSTTRVRLRRRLASSSSAT